MCAREWRKRCHNPPTATASAAPAAAPQMRDRLDFISVGSLGNEKLGRDVQQARAADQLQIRQRQNRGEEYGKDYAQERRQAGAENEAPSSLPRRQSATCHRNHEGIVAGQQCVDEDDLTYGEPEGRVAELIDSGTKPIAPQ